MAAEVVEQRQGTDGKMYFAAVLGPYDVAYWWVAWRAPMGQGASAGEILGGIMNRADSAKEAKDAARALLDRVVPRPQP